FPKNKIIRYEGDIFKFIEEVSLMETIVGSKLHVLIASHILGKPFFAIKYQEKVGYFMEQIGYENHLFTYDQTESIFDLVLKKKYDRPIVPSTSLYEKLNKGLKEVVKIIE
ncbi:MAG: polysaccharide pyruvyl transferase family protein, partial [Candidatus Pelagibacter ubique]